MAGNESPKKLPMFYLLQFYYLITWLRVAGNSKQTSELLLAEAYFFVIPSVGNGSKDYWKSACLEIGIFGLEEGSWIIVLNDRE